MRKGRRGREEGRRREGHKCSIKRKGAKGKTRYMKRESAPKKLLQQGTRIVWAGVEQDQVHIAFRLLACLAKSLDSGR